MNDPADAPYVLVLYVEAGEGHRSAAAALTTAGAEAGAPWRLRLTNMQAVLGSVDSLRQLTGIAIDTAYNTLLRRDWLGGITPLLRLLHLGIRVRRPALVQAARAYLAAQSPPPLAVVSVAPHFNAILAEACRATLPGVPFLVALTDYADYPPRFWMEPGLGQIVVASEEAAAQAAAMGLGPECVTRISGLPLRPEFFDPGAALRRPATRASMGFAAEDRVLLLSFGGVGSAAMPTLAQDLLQEPFDWKVVAVCGDNPPLEWEMRYLAARFPGRMHVLAHTDTMADIMAASDLLLGKAGSISLTEAFQLRLPVVVCGNRKTLPQERGNVRLVADHELGWVVRSWREAPRVARRAFEDAQERARIAAGLARWPLNRGGREIIAAIDAAMAAATPSQP